MISFFTNLRLILLSLFANFKFENILWFVSFLFHYPPPLSIFKWCSYWTVEVITNTSFLLLGLMIIILLIINSSKPQFNLSRFFLIVKLQSTKLLKVTLVFKVFHILELPENYKRSKNLRIMSFWLQRFFYWKSLLQPRIKHANLGLPLRLSYFNSQIKHYITAIIW